MRYERVTRTKPVATCVQAEERTELESEMHMRFGVHLFGEGDYDGAMAHFGMCSRATPVLLLKLFPSLAPTALMEPIAPCFPGARHSMPPSWKFGNQAWECQHGGCGCSCSVCISCCSLSLLLRSHRRAGHDCTCCSGCNCFCSQCAVGQL